MVSKRTGLLVERASPSHRGREKRLAAQSRAQRLQGVVLNTVFPRLLRERVAATPGVLFYSA